MSGPRESQQDTDAVVDVVAFGAHPDDIELGCGGLLALLIDRGYRVAGCHLTRGENGTRGTGEERVREASAAGRELGLHHVDHLDCGDAGLRTGSVEEDAVIEVLRRRRPRLVLAPPPHDRHPDHERAHRLVFDSTFYAGLQKRAPELGTAHRPQSLFWYMLHQTFQPTLLIDVTSVWDRKMAALEAYASQFAGASDPEQSEVTQEPRTEVSSTEGGSCAEPTTHISSRDFWAAIEGRGRHYGQQIGVAFAEPLACRLPVAVHDPLWLLAAGRP